ncbi:hypothetical protein QYM36_003396 [Artemia franciscana]|uniref:DUF4371 domain-containing protein n=1 Tax=Artemia franciscana TaxID=6661 RepID=A0AA88IFU2_ARTSF|nr:hypothetical protein QYM36_003396 [Artemia franciscana]
MDGSQMPLNPVFESTSQKRQAVSLCEMRLVAWFAAEDVPFKKAASLTAVLKASVSDSSILRQTKLKRTKVKGVIHDLMAPRECQTLADLLTRAHYSLIVDETTDKSSAKALVMIAKYKHHATLLVGEYLLSLVEVTDASSEGQKKLIQTYLKDIGAPVSNLIGIAYDNAFVSTGVHDGLGALFQESLTHFLCLDAQATHLRYMLTIHPRFFRMDWSSY